jgi:hypothetical protein
LLFRIATYIFVLFRSQEKIPAIQALPEEFHFRSGYKVQANFCVVTEWVPIDNAVARKEITKRERHFNVSKSSFISSVHIIAAILASLHMRTADDLFGGPQGSPRTDKLIHASVQWAERIMRKIDNVSGRQP